jgi:alkylation response protein AidB-like acyl-CoA dehydrogenase
MNFALSDDQREIQALARDVAQAEIEPNAGAWDREHRFPVELYAKLAELGLMGVCVPGELGGAAPTSSRTSSYSRSSRAADAVSGVTVAGAHERLHAADLAFWAARSRASASCHRSRAARRSARSRSPSPRPGSEAGALRNARRRGRRRLDDHRREAVDHERQSTRAPSHRSPRASPRSRERAASPPSCSTPSTSEVTREEEKLGLNSSSTADLVLEGAHVGRDGCCTRKGAASPVAMATLDGGPDRDRGAGPSESRRPA